MKLIILRGNLKQGLGALERAVVENNNLPILKNILITADTRVTLQATNLEIGVTYTTSAKITEPGSLSIPFTPLYSIIQNSTSERITMESADNSLTVKTDNYEAKIQGVAAEEFPIIPKIESEDRSFEIGGEVFSVAMNQILGAAATNDLKPELNSILFDVQADKLICAATDGFRLAEKKFPHNTVAINGLTTLKALVPLKTVQEILRVFPGGEQYKISFDDHQILCTTEDITLISRLIDGAYPEYGAIIPKQTPCELVFDREQLASAIKLVSNFSGKTSDVKLHPTADGKTLEVFASNQLIGENVYQVPIKKKKGDGIREIVFNWRYLYEGVRALPDNTITLALSGETKPAILKPAEDDSVFYIVMPIQQ